MACNSPLTWSIFISCVLLCDNTCPTFTTYHNIGLINPGNFTGQCPSLLVKSQTDCLQKFCDIRRKVESSCRGDAVQFTVIGNTSVCYILQYQSQIKHCVNVENAKTDNVCRLEHDNRSTLYFVQYSAESGSTVCPTADTCDNGECTPHTRCNGRVECTDQSDERDCDFDKFEATCDTEVYFQCRRDAQCIPLSLHCDGELFCSDGSDEMGCDEYLIKRNNDTMKITAIAVGTILTLLLIVLMFACGQRLFSAHYTRRARLRNLRLGSCAADYVVRLLPGEQPFDDTLPPPYNETIPVPADSPPMYEPLDVRERLIDLAESSGYVSPNSQDSSSKLEDITQCSDISQAGPSSFDTCETEEKSSE